MVFKCDAVPWGLSTGLIVEVVKEDPMVQFKAIHKKKFDFIMVNFFERKVVRTGSIEDFIEFSQIKADLQLESKQLQNLGIRISEFDIVRGEKPEFFKTLIIQEIEFASYLGVNSVLLKVLTNYPQSQFESVVSAYCDVLVKTKQFIKDDLNIILQIDLKQDLGDCDPWKVYNQIRLINTRNYQISLNVYNDVPSLNEQRRWLAENVKQLNIRSEVFQSNNKGFPVLDQKTEKFIISFFKYQVSITFQGQLPHYDLTEHRNFICFLYKNQPKISENEEIASSYYDALQEPLQPYKDNLHSYTYEVFEQDPIKYEYYQKAVHQYFEDNNKDQQFIVVLAGAGRGGILFRIIAAAKASKVNLKCIAVEKNPYAYLTLKFLHSQQKWGSRVEIINEDLKTYTPNFQADLIVSELLGSFGDNELSPECLSWAQRFLKPDGVSIPQNSISYLTPVTCPLLHTKIRNQKGVTGYHRPHVVYMHRYYAPNEILPCFTYNHPDFQTSCPLTTVKTLQFEIKQDLLIHGLAGYFDSTLYKNVILSTHPEKHTPGMYSWFEIFFPFEKPQMVYNNQCIELTIHRINDEKRVWYEWNGRICEKKAIEQNNEEQFVYETISEIQWQNKNGQHSAIFIE